MVTTKSEIGKIFRKLEKWNWQVVNFGSNKPIRGKAQGWVDIVVLNQRTICFIEIKSKDTSDSLRPAQRITAFNLSSISTHCHNFHYFQIRTVKEAKDLQERILANKL